MKKIRTLFFARLKSKTIFGRVALLEKNVDCLDTFTDDLSERIDDLKDSKSEVTEEDYTYLQDKVEDLADRVDDLEDKDYTDEDGNELADFSLQDMCNRLEELEEKISAIEENGEEEVEVEDIETFGELKGAFADLSARMERLEGMDARLHAIEYLLTEFGKACTKNID